MADDKAGGHGAAAAGGAGLGLMALLRVCGEVGVVDDLARVGAAGSGVVDDVARIGAGSAARMADDAMGIGAHGAALEGGFGDDAARVLDDAAGAAGTEGRVTTLFEEFGPDAVDLSLDVIDIIELDDGPAIAEGEGVWLGEITDAGALYRTLPRHRGQTVGFVGRFHSGVLHFGAEPIPLSYVEHQCKTHQVSCWVYLLGPEVPLLEAVTAWEASDERPLMPEHGAVRVLGGR